MIIFNICFLSLLFRVNTGHMTLTKAALLLLCEFEVPVLRINAGKLFLLSFKVSFKVLILLIQTNIGIDHVNIAQAIVKKENSDKQHLCTMSSCFVIQI